MYDPAAARPAGLGSVSSVERREIMYAAVQYARYLFRCPRGGKFDVTALLDRGDIRFIFVVNRAEHRILRRVWRSFINAANLGLAIGHLAVDGADGRPRVAATTQDPRLKGAQGPDQGTT